MDVGVADYVFKIVLVGDAAVGKSSLARRFCHDEFEAHSKPTVGVDFLSKIVVNKQGSTCQIHVWDTAALERFAPIISSYYRGAQGVIVAFDITNRASFEHACAKWFDEARKHADSHVFFVLVGTKKDLKHRRAVSSAEAAEWAESHNMSYVETSAADDISVDAAFESLIDAIFDRVAQKPVADDPHAGPPVGVKVQTAAAADPPATGCWC